MEILTKEAREILSETVTLKQMVQQSANLASMVIAMYRGDEQLVGRAMNDVVIEPQRKQLIPHFDEVKNAALKTAKPPTFDGSNVHDWSFSVKHYVQTIGLTTPSEQV